MICPSLPQRQGGKKISKSLSKNKNWKIFFQNILRLERGKFWIRSKFLRKNLASKSDIKKIHPKVWSTICVYIYISLIFDCRFEIWSSICLYGFLFLNFHFETWGFIFHIGGSICIYLFWFLDFHFEIGSSICLYWFSFLDFHFENWSFVLKN